jgi:hypothetical protein
LPPLLWLIALTLALESGGLETVSKTAEAFS